MLSPFQDYHRTHRELVAYFNGAIYSIFDVLCSMIPAMVPLNHHARTAINSHKALWPWRGDEATRHQANIKVYTGDTPSVLMMMAYLKEHLGGDLIGAYVHGSLGTGEEMPYSDFDALAIIKDQVFEDENKVKYVGRKLSAAQSIMFDYDPLQHHGWFILTENQLNAYPEWYFPVELFSQAKSLFSEQGRDLTLQVMGSRQECRDIFIGFSDAILQKIRKRAYPRNVYQLKSLLSAFMLLPALYVQARDGKSVYKKDSFDRARRDFLPAEWAVMNEVSTIRKSWTVNIPRARRRLLAASHPVVRYLGMHFAPRVPSVILQHLTLGFYDRMSWLILAMRNKLV